MTWVVRFQQPCRLMSMNDRSGWRARNRATRAWRRAAFVATLEQLGGMSSNDALGLAWRLYEARQRDAVAGHQVVLPPVLIEFVFPVPDRRVRDPHNYFPTVKAIVDGVADAAVWPSDGPDWVATVEPRLMVKAPLVAVTMTERRPS